MMASIVGPYDPPFDPWDRPPTWLVPLCAVRREAKVLGVICKGYGRRRWWLVDELIEHYGARRMGAGTVGALPMQPPVARLTACPSRWNMIPTPSDEDNEGLDQRPVLFCFRPPL